MAKRVEIADRLTFRDAYVQIWRAYRRWAPFLLLLALIVFTPVGLIHAITDGAEIGNNSGEGVASILAKLTALAALATTGLLGEVFYTGAVAAFLTHAHDREPPSMRQVAREIRYWRLIGVDLAYALIVIAGLLLFVVPGVAAYVWFALVATLVELEDRSARGAFVRSAKLVRGRFWAVLAVLVPLELFGNASTALVGELSGSQLGHGFLAEWLADLASNLVFTPFYAVAAVLMAVILIREKDGVGPRVNPAPVLS